MYICANCCITVDYVRHVRDGSQFERLDNATVRRLVTLFCAAKVPCSNSTEPLQENIRIVPQKWTWFGMATQGVPFIFTNVVAFHKMVPLIPILPFIRKNQGANFVHRLYV